MGRHRSTGRHRAPVEVHPRRRLVIVCGCALCAAVIPLFAQQATVSNPPDLTAVPAVTAVAPVALTPPTFTIQPRVDVVGLVTKVNAELSKHDDSPKADGSKSDSKSTSDDSSPDSTDTEGHHSHKHGDPTPKPTCQ